MRKLFVLVFIWLYVSYSVSADTTDTLWLKYIGGKNASGLPGNRIVGELARENGYLLRKFRLGYVFERTTFCQPHNGEMQVTFNYKGISGPSTYLGYPLDHVLTPVGFRLKIEVKEFGKVLFDETLPWPKEEPAVVKLQTHSCSDTLLFQLSEPIFTEAQAEILKAAMYDIRTYKAVDLALQSAWNIAQSFEYRDTTCVGCLIAAAVELERVSTILSQLVDSLALPLDKTDPDRLMENLLKMNGEVYRRSLFLSRLRNFTTDDAFKAGLSSEAFLSNWIKSEGFLNPLYNHVFRKLARIKNSERYSLFDKVSLWLPGLPSQWQELYARKLSEALLNSSREMQSAGRFDQAFILAANARDILKMIGHDDEADLMEHHLQEPMLGLYRVYLDVATDAVKNGNLRMGDEYLQKAIAFRAQNRAYMPGGLTDAEVYGRFADACLDKIIRLHEQGLYEEAFPYLLKAYDYARRITVYLRFPELDRMRSELAQKSYGQLLEKALDAYKIKDYASAAEFFEKWNQVRKTWSAWLQFTPEDDSIAKKYRISRLFVDLQELKVLVAQNVTDSLYAVADQKRQEVVNLHLTDQPEFCNLIREVGRLFFDAALKETGSYLWDFKFTEARSSFALADSISVRFHIADCEDVNQMLETMQQRMNRQNVIYATFLYDRYYYKTVSSFEAGSFALGKAYADTALQWCCCGCDAHNLESLVGKYAPAIRYDKYLQRLEYFYALQQADSMEFVRQRLFTWFQTDSTLSQHFTQPDTLWLIKLKPRSWVFDYYFGPLMEKGKPEYVLLFMEKLRSEGIPGEWLENWQMLTARAIAAKDIHIRNTEAAYQRLAQLAPDVVWYKVFREVYISKRLSVFQRMLN